MWKAIKMFKNSSWQTKFFIFNGMIYMVALIWTTLQAYARLEYSRSDLVEPIIIQAKQPSDHS